MPLRCSACPTRDDGRPCPGPIPPSGSSQGQCDYLFIGTGPGKTEAQKLKPYVGKAGEELDETYLPLAGLHREDVVVTNGSACWDLTDRTPSEKRILACAKTHLPSLLDRVRPVVVVLMGGATQCLADKRIRLNVHHGRPQWTSLLGGEWEGWVWPSYEPALGMRDTGMMAPLMEDFRNLGRWMRGEWTPPIPEEETTDYQICQTPNAFLDYVGIPIGTAPPPIACDTEDHGPELWSIQISHTPRTGRLIRTDNEEVMQAFAEWSRYTWAEWIFHFAIHDLGKLHQLGIDISNYRDTMHESYHLSLPQGLKSLVYRLFGHEMRSWEDTVWPASIAKMNGWLDDAIALASTRPDELVTEMKRGTCEACGHYHSRGPCKCGCEVMKLTRRKVETRPSAIESILRHVHRYTTQTMDAEEPYDPWKKLPEMRAEGLRGRVAGAAEWDWIEGELGPVPVLGIGNCSEAEAVAYACLSAHSLVQTEEGNQDIAELVKTKYAGRVWSVSVDGHLELKPVIGWHRVIEGKRGRGGGRIPWQSVETELFRNNRWKTTGTRYTPDHRLLTPSGYRPISAIQSGDDIYLPFAELDSVQVQVTYGTLLGDGSLLRRNRDGWASLRMAHCDRQKPYLEWKAQLLGELVQRPISKNTFRSTPLKIGKKWARPTQSWSVDTVCHPSLSRLRDVTYMPPRKGKRSALKIVPDWVNEIDELALAIWYQDDGSIVWDKSGIGSPRFYTLGFSNVDCARLCRVLLNKFGLVATIFDMKGWAIHIARESAFAFYELIAPWVHPCMQYKVPECFRGRFRGSPERQHNGLVIDRVVRVFHNTTASRRRGLGVVSYCIDVADNHNFCTQAEVAHNCGDSDCTLRVARRLELERQDKRWVVDKEDYDE